MRDIYREPKTIMASVSSLDQDMRKLRLSRYTPAAAKEARTWIEDTLGERLPGGDILDALKDGTMLCKLANLVLPSPGIKYKRSNMPFIQMENISHFLRACESPPLNLPAHDRFLTVDLYESKDPAQVLQCLGSFSRVANSLLPAKFPTTIGPKRGGTSSPVHLTGPSNGASGFSTPGHGRGFSVASAGASSVHAAAADARAVSPVRTGGSSSSRATDGGTRSPAGNISSWSKKSDEAVSAPAWNIHQYGYMGGASQGNQGIAFGARRQITTPAPYVPSLAEKERKRREQDVEDARLRVLAEEAEQKRKVERQAEEERARVAEEKKWEEETRRVREEEKRRVEQQKREWEEQERKWKEDEEARLKEERQAYEEVGNEPQRKRGLSDVRLQGQYLSHYQAEQKARSRQTSYNDPERSSERDRIRELERQLEQAKDRELEYEREREERLRKNDERQSQRKARSRSRSRPRPAPRPPSPQDSNVSWVGDEREYIRQQQRGKLESQRTPPSSQRPLPVPHEATPPPALSSRPLPEPTSQPPISRPLPDPTSLSPGPGPTPPDNRTGRFLAQNPAPVAAQPKSYYPAELGLTSESERRAEDSRRVQSQQKTKAGGWASKSLLEREMERERERQRDWEESQNRTNESTPDKAQGSGPGKSWDVNQYGFTGGDSQNRPGNGIGFGGRRQIIGPRPPPS